MAKYLDYTGLQYFWNKIKLWVKGYINVSVTGNNKTITIDNDGTVVTIQPIETVKILDTTNSNSLSTNSSETITGSGEIDLHKISKTGSYNDLLNKPTIPATNVIPATSTQNKVLVSTSTSGTAKWSDWSSAGFLKTNTNGVIDIDTTAYAPLASPALTGTPTAPTATSGANTTQIATTEFVQTAITTAQVGAAMFQGVIKSDNVSPEPTALPTTNYKKGQYWIVGTASQVTSQPGDPGHPVYSPTYAGQVCEVGDTIFCVKDYVQGTASNSDFNIVQNNIDTITNGEIDNIIAGS